MASKSLTRRHASPPARVKLRGCAGGLLSMWKTRPPVQPELPEKSVTQCWMLCGPSLKRVVSIVVLLEAPRPQGCIAVARHSPAIIAFAQLYSVRLTRAPSTETSLKRKPLPLSAPQKPTPWPPRRHQPERISPLIAAAGASRSSTVRVSALIPDHEPGSRLHHPPSPRAQRRRLSKASIPCGKPATKLRGAVSVEAAEAKTSKLPLPHGTAPSRCSMPSCSACHQVPLTRVMPVPAGASQRQRAKRVPLTVDWPSRVKLFTWAPSKGSWPAGGTHQASGRNLAAPVVSARLASAPTYQPHWATLYLPACASRAASSSNASASAIPSTAIRAIPLRVPDMTPPPLDGSGGLREERGDLSPVESPQCPSRRRTRSPRSCVPSSIPSCAARSSSWAWCARSRSRRAARSRSSSR